MSDAAVVDSCRLAQVIDDGAALCTSCKVSPLFCLHVLLGSRPVLGRGGALGTSASVKGSTVHMFVFSFFSVAAAAAAAAAVGTLLGGGGALGSGGAIQQFVPDPQQRQKLFESVAYDCQINQQPDEARELFMAAQKPRAALKIINQQLSAAIHANRGEHVISEAGCADAAVVDTCGGVGRVEQGASWCVKVSFVDACLAST
jgi:hypothetical protein